MTELISIIVPVYNAKVYLKRCIGSVLQQTYSHFELLLIDDGSEDGSGDVCEELAQADRRCSFFPRPHQGVSAARNAGIDAARGKYLFFLDSDDTLHPRLLEALVELCEATGAALATEIYRHVDGAAASHAYLDSLDQKDHREWGYTYMGNAEAIRQFSSHENGYNFHGIGGKMIRRSEVGNLRFDEELINSEDTLFVYRLLNMGLSAVILWEKWYDYWGHEDSSSRRMTVRACKDINYCMEYICDQEQEQGREESVRFWTRVASARFRRLYMRSRAGRNREVSAYLRALAGRLSSSGRFSMLSRADRWKHYLAFHCYPLYIPLHKAMTWQWERKERKRNAGDWNEERFQ